jgi:hypothetical protein
MLLPYGIKIDLRSRPPPAIMRVTLFSLTFPMQASQGASGGSFWEPTALGRAWIVCRDRDPFGVLVLQPAHGHRRICIDPGHVFISGALILSSAIAACNAGGYGQEQDCGTNGQGPSRKTNFRHRSSSRVATDLEVILAESHTLHLLERNGQLLLRRQSELDPKQTSCRSRDSAV